MDDRQALHYDSSRVLTASEIGSYLYCNRSWWLNKVGDYQPANVEDLEVGTWLHAEHGYEVQRASSMNRLAVALLVGAGLMLLIWLLAQVL